MSASRSGASVPPVLPPPRWRLGVDVGGTKLEIAALAPSGAIALRERIATPAGDYEATVRAIAALVEGAEARLGAPGSVGLGIPGSLSPVDGRVRNANSTCLNGQPLREDLERRLGRPVRIDNDANCFALSEARDGAAAGARVVFGVILGTGVGGGLVIDGRPWRGANGIAGEWGHNPLPWPQAGEWPGPRCWCGRHGCIETWLSGPGWHASLGALADGFDDAAAIGAALADAAPDEPRGRRARLALERWHERLARALAAVVNLLDPDVIVLGGGLSALPGTPQAMAARLAPLVFADRLATPVVGPRHGDSSGVRGAAWLWDDAAAGGAPAPAPAPAPGACD